MHKVYFPWLPGAPAAPVTGQGYPCGMTAQEAEYVRLLRTHPEQQRERLTCDERLCAAARYKAALCRRLDEVEHTLDGETPNELVRRFGVALPNWYPTQGNSVESLSAGHPTAWDSFNALLHSPRHRAHLLGEAFAYREQVRIGVAYYHDDEPRHAWNAIWCVLTAP